MAQIIESKFPSTSALVPDTPTLQNRTEVHWIKPVTPTRLDGCLTMPLPGMDQIFFPIDGVYLLPGPIDVERLKKAIALTLSAYPHAAGRLKRGTDGSWKFLLNKSTVPLTVTTGDRVPTDEELREGYAPVLDPLPYSFIPPPDMESYPLVRWKLTSYPRQNASIVVIHACHALGDGLTIARMQQTVSDFYQGLPAVHPFPTFEKYFEKPERLSPGDFARTLEHVPNLKADYAPAELVEMWNKTKETTERVDLIFSKAQLGALQKKASLPAGQRLSTGDALVGYMFTVFNRVYPYKFDQLMNVVQYRGRKSPPDAPYQLPSITSAGNVLFHSVSAPIPEEKLLDLGQLALAVRDTIAKTNAYDFLRDCVALCEQRYDEMGLVGRLPWMNPGPRALGANLLHKAPFQTAHFGYGADRCCFYTFPANEHYFRVFPANALRLADGTWQPRPGSLHVFFRVAHGFGAKMHEVMSSDFAGLEDVAMQGDGRSEKSVQATRATRTQARL